MKAATEILPCIRPDRFGYVYRLGEEMRKTLSTPSRHCSTRNSSEPINKKFDLHRSLRTKILARGPITVAEYMNECLTNPIAGYYTTKRNVLGQKGDFITSPEITQVFGEMIALWILTECKKLTKGPFQLVELGPGKGTLMKDILRVFKKLCVTKEISIHLIEISPILASAQAESLHVRVQNDLPRMTNKQNTNMYYKMGETEDGIKVYWYYSINDIPKKFSVFVAHEFFDALPIHKFERTSDGWKEVLIDIDEQTDKKKFRYVLSRTSTVASQFYIPADEKRHHIEISPQSMVIVENLCTFLIENGGFAFIGDYGHNGEKSDTFRAFYRHTQQDPLMNPGCADLTADVDFSLIKRTAEKDNRAITFGPLSQRNFLKNLGIDVRLKKILETATPEQKEHIKSGYHMIIDSDKMGECFKVLALFPYVLKQFLDRWKVAGFTNNGKT